MSELDERREEWGRNKARMALKNATQPRGEPKLVCGPRPEAAPEGSEPEVVVPAEDQAPEGFIGTGASL